MEKFHLTVEMTYVAEVYIDAETLEEAKAEARDLAGDGKLLDDAELQDVTYMEW